MMGLSKGAALAMAFACVSPMAGLGITRATDRKRVSEAFERRSHAA
jgi:hypothetical protein